MRYQTKEQKMINLVNDVSDIRHQNQEVLINCSHVSEGPKSDLNTKKASILHWVLIPAEIRLMILELLLQERHGCGVYACICKEWQAVIEKKNFHRLKLQASCLDDFEQIVSRQRGLVKHIWLNIKLRAYTCRCCQYPESSSWYSGDLATISSAISKLFNRLSTWKPTRGGLTLELSIQSPSDSEHWFKNCYFGADDESENAIFEPRDKPMKIAAKLHDPKHGWLDGRQNANLDGSLLRLFSEISVRHMGLLPTVNAVTKFVLRRQCRRRFNVETLSVLFDKLPRLEHIVYEPWQIWNRWMQQYYDKEFKTMVEAHLPKGMKRLSLFEDFNDDYIPHFRRSGSPVQPDAVRIPDPGVSAAFASRSLDLEQLSISFMVNAKHFFQARQPLWTWNHLQSLVLTSRLLAHTANRSGVSDLLQDAGEAAFHMPKLHTMALWNCGKGEACIFTYCKEDNNPSITWRGTWDLKIEPRVIQAWEMVASKYTTSEIRVKKQYLSCGAFISHGDAMYQLDLPRGVIDPVSLWQIWKEGRSWHGI